MAENPFKIDGTFDFDFVGGPLVEGPLVMLNPGDFELITQPSKVRIRPRLGGALLALQHIGAHLNIATPTIKGLMANRNQFITSIMSFYSDSTCTITSDDAEALIKLVVYGGSVSRWIKCLENGEFKTYDDVSVGVTVAKKCNVRPVTGQQGVYYPRPISLASLDKEVKRVVGAFVSKNQSISEDLCYDLEDPDTIGDYPAKDNTFRRSSRIITGAIFRFLASVVKHTVFALLQSGHVQGDAGIVATLSNVSFKLKSASSVDDVLHFLKDYTTANGLLDANYMLVEELTVPIKVKATASSVYAVFAPQAKKAKTEQNV